MKHTRITIRQLEAFVNLAKTGNFHKSAEVAGLSQSALSASLKHLEQELGFALIDRNTRKVSVSHIGQELLPAIERILGDIDALTVQAEAVAAGRSGPIRIVGLHSITTRLLPPVMASFLKSNPGVHFAVTEHTTSEIIHEVSKGTADVGFTSFRANAADLTFSPLLGDDYVLVAPKNHPLARKRAVNWDEIARFPFIGMVRGTQTRELMDQILQAHGRAIVPMHEAFHFATVEQMIMQNMGIAAVPALILSREHRSRLAVRSVHSPVITRHLGIVVRRGKRQIPAVEQFLSLLRDYVQKLKRPGIRSIVS